MKTNKVKKNQPRSITSDVDKNEINKMYEHCNLHGATERVKP